MRGAVDEKVYIKNRKRTQKSPRWVPSPLPPENISYISPCLGRNCSVQTQKMNLYQTMNLPSFVSPMDFFFHFKITLGKIWTTISVHFAEENVSSEGGELVLCVEYRKSLKWYKPDLRTWLPGGRCPLNHLQISHNPISLENPG